MIPTVGRIILYGKRKSQPVPAIVTEVHGPHCVSLTAFPPGAPPMPVVKVMHGDVHGADPVWAWPRMTETATPKTEKPAPEKKTAPVEPTPPLKDPEPAADLTADPRAEPAAETSSEPSAPDAPSEAAAPEAKPAAAEPAPKVSPSKPPSARPSRSRA